MPSLPSRKDTLSLSANLAETAAMTAEAVIVVTIAGVDAVMTAEEVTVAIVAMIVPAAKTATRSRLLLLRRTILPRYSD